jgi:hypothetical protein
MNITKNNVRKNYRPTNKTDQETSAESVIRQLDVSDPASRHIHRAWSVLQAVAREDASREEHRQKKNK